MLKNTKMPIYRTFSKILRENFLRVLNESVNLSQ